MSQRKRLGEILVEAGRITETQLAAALHSQRTWGGKLGSSLVRMGFIREEEILECLSAQLRLPSVDFRKIIVSPKAIQTMPLKVAEKYGVIPVAVEEKLGKKSVILAMSDPTDLDSIREIEFQTGLGVRPVIAAEPSIFQAIDRYYRGRERSQGYGYEKEVDPSALQESGEMVVIRGGEETRVSPLSGVEPGALLAALIRVLEAKGVIRQKDLEEALRRE
jgi:hypothetical protein